MGRDWKSNLSGYFEEIGILQSSIAETLDKFGQFCEFVAEPAFESLKEELGFFGVQSRIKHVKGKSITFQINFAGSRIDNLNYKIRLPKNSIELKLRLHIKGRKCKKAVLQEMEEPFMEPKGGEELMTLAKEELIEDVIEHLRNFNFAALTDPEA